MKRKFGNLLMAATLVLAVGSFFTSCRDYDEELVAMIDQQSQTIEALNKELCGSIADLKNEVNNALSSAQAEIAALEAQIAALNARIEVLEGINHDHSNFVTKDELAAAKAELAAAKAELEAAVKELADKKADKQTLEEVKASLEASIDELKGEFASHVELFNQLSATATEALGRLATLEGKYTALDERVKAIEDAKYQEQINTIKGDLEKVVKQAAEADARSKANEAAIKALEAYNVELAQAVKDSVAALRAEAAANLAEAKAYADEAAAAVAAELAKTNATVAELQAAFNVAVAELQDQIDVLQEEVDEVKANLAGIEKTLGLVKEYLNNQITSVVLNGAYSPVVGYFSLPTGVKSNILAAYYGEAANDFHFPTTRTAYNVAGSVCFSDEDFAVMGIEETLYPGGVIVAEGANAGKLYMTLNPAEVSLAGKSFALVNSLGEESPVKISNVKVSEDKLAFGYTRGAVALYEAEAAIAAEDVEAAKLRVELSGLKDALKDLVTVSDGVNVSDLVTTLYTVVNDIADANAVQATWADSYGAHTVYSDFGLAAVAVKPLGYNFLADVNVQSMPGYNRAMNFLNGMYDRLFTSIKVRIPDFGINNLVLPEIKKIEIAELSDELLAKFKVTVHETVTVKVPVKMDVTVPAPKMDDVTVDIPGVEVTVTEKKVQTTVKEQWVTVPGQEVEVTLEDGSIAKAMTKPQQVKIEARDVEVTVPAGTYTTDGTTVTIKGDQLLIKDFVVSIDEQVETDVVIGPFEYDMSEAVKDLYGDLTGSIEDVNDMLAGLQNFMDEVNVMLDQLKGYENKVENVLDAVEVKVKKNLNKYLDKLNAKVCGFINSFNGRLQPTMLVSTVDGFTMLSSMMGAPTVVDNASAVFVPTSYTAEILAPASKKFVAVTKAYDANGNADLAAVKAANAGEFATVLPGGTRTVQFNGKSGYTYEITYSAVDFYGMISTSKYYVKVK